MEENVIDILEKLQDNAMYRLSMSSRELFHSNFWAWLIDKDNKFTSVFYDEYDNDIDVEVLREKNNFDLSLEIGDKFIIIENKFKSLPNKSQLKEYLDKVETSNDDNTKVKLILISYMPPSFELDNIKMKYISYKTIYERLKNIALQQTKCNNTEIAIIKNYIGCLGLFVNLQDKIKIDNGSSSKFKTFWNEYYKGKNKNSKLIQQLEKMNFKITFQRIFLSEFIKYVENKSKRADLWAQIQTGNNHIAYAELGINNINGSIAVLCNGEYRYNFKIDKHNSETREALIDKCDKIYGAYLEQKECKMKKKKYNSFMQKECAYVYRKKDICDDKTFEELAEEIIKDLLEIKNIKTQ